MKRNWMVVGLALLFAAPLAWAEEPLGKKGVEDRLMILFRDGVDVSQQKSLANKYNLDVLRVYDFMGALVVKAKPGTVSLATSSPPASARCASTWNGSLLSRFAYRSIPNRGFEAVAAEWARGWAGDDYTASAAR